MTVKEKVYPVESVSLDKTSLELTEGDETTLTATITPDNASNKNVTWISSNTEVATIENGKVTAVKAGTATITVMTEDGGKTATCDVTVKSIVVNGGIEGTEDYKSIEFADPIMKEMCVNAFDTNKDGELSFAEARSVTDLSKMTLTKKTFKSFDELQYFVSLKSIPYHYFEDCTLMKSITLPQNVVSIYYEAFMGCSSLTSIVLPEGVTNIGDWCFYKCSSLTSIVLPEGMTSIGSGCFEDCSSLTSINLPEGVTSIGDWCFAGCSSLTSIVLPEDVTNIGDCCFYKCSSLTSINLPQTIANIGDEAFWSCYDLLSIYVRPILPPILIDNDNSYYHFKWNASDRKIYVPHESLEAYITAEGWSEYADAIVGYDFENDKVVE